MKKLFSIVLAVLKAFVTFFKGIPTKDGDVILKTGPGGSYTKTYYKSGRILTTKKPKKEAKPRRKVDTNPVYVGDQPIYRQLKLQAALDLTKEEWTKLMEEACHDVFAYEQTHGVLSPPMELPSNKAADASVYKKV